jgi:putative tricarboxylic transport membrane protein
MFVVGLFGVLIRRFDFPSAPVIVGMILGPIGETQLRNAISIGDGKWSVLVSRPISLFLLIVTALVLIVPPIVRARGKLQKSS